MPHDPALLSETKAWFKKAATDIRAAEHALLAHPPLLEDLLFHCQQASEKSLKGFLTWNSKPFRRTHSLEELGELCLSIDPSLKPVIDPIVPLTQYAWEFRYPGDPQDPTAEEAGKALTAARKAHLSLLSFMPEEVRGKKI
jgi:HEPN domain-containing protein